MDKETRVGYRTQPCLRSRRTRESESSICWEQKQYRLQPGQWEVAGSEGEDGLRKRTDMLKEVLLRQEAEDSGLRQLLGVQEQHLQVTGSTHLFPPMLFH